MNPVTTQGITLTVDQQTALDALYVFLMDPIETVFVLSGFSGCGKSTLVRTMLDRIQDFLHAARLINPSQVEYTPELTATTNKAAENLAQITGYPVKTIHSFLGLRVVTDYKTDTSKLVASTASTIEQRLLFIDEASYINQELLRHIFGRTSKCKIVFVGDPAQLAPVKSNSTPVFNAGFTEAALTQVVRQAEGNPIIDLSTKFRNTVNTGEFFGFKPDGNHVQRLDRVDFNAAIDAEFSRPDWHYQDSKILVWTNKCAIAFNKYVRNLAQGDPNFQVGDYAVCNQFLSINRYSIKTDQLVHITKIGPDVECHGVMGNWVELDHYVTTFQPKSLADKNAAIKQFRGRGDIHLVADIEGRWVDLRGAFACTINKAQGSTFDEVFIDLDDIRGCNSGDQIARMMYVAVSRARNRVYLTGDLA